MREPIRLLSHLGSGEEGAMRKVRLQQICLELGATTPTSDPEPSIGRLLQMIADGYLRVESAVSYQFWTSILDGETYAVMLVSGEPKWINGPLHYSEVILEDLPNFNWDDPFEEDPDRFVLASVHDEVDAG